MTIQNVNVDQVLYGHGTLKNIVSVSACGNNQVQIWIRENGVIRTFKNKFTPWALIGDKKLLPHLEHCKLQCLAGTLKYSSLALLSDKKSFEKSAVAAQNRINRKNETRLPDTIYMPNVVEQFLIQSGNTHFKDMTFSELVRLQLDIETTGLDPIKDKIFMVAVSTSSGFKKVIHGENEPEILRELNSLIAELDPDVIENHNLFGFDLPFILQRYRSNFIELTWGRDKGSFFTYDDKLKVGESTESFTRYSLKGRELIDTLHAIKRYDAVARKFENYKLKYVAKSFGVARDVDGYIDGSKIYETYRSDPERVIKYAGFDVDEVEKLSAILHQDKFYLSQIVSMQFQKICTSGSSKLIEYPLVRAYLFAKHSLPAPRPSKSFEGAHVELCRTGVFENVTKFDVASMYPNIILAEGITPSYDPLCIFQTLMRLLTELRLFHKRQAKENNDKTSDAVQSALKIVINSGYGYLGSERALFNNPDGAAKVTAVGREIIHAIKQAIIELGGVPIEIDTDGIIAQFPNEKYTPNEFSEHINGSLTRFKTIKVEPESNQVIKCMYVYKKKNYAYLDKGKLKIVGAAFKSRSMEPIFSNMITHGLQHVLNKNIGAFYELIADLHQRIVSGACTSEELVSRTKINKSIKEYLATRKVKSPHFEVLIAANIEVKAGEFSTYYKSQNGYRHISQFANDYDVRHYLKQFHSKLKLFKEAINSEVFSLIAELKKPAYQGDTFIQSVVDPLQQRQWINLAANIKLSEIDSSNEVTRNMFCAVDDQSTIDKFLKKHKAIDVYRSAYVYLATTKPSAPKKTELTDKKMLGDFYIEFEGHKTDIETMRCAARAIFDVERVLIDEFEISREHTKLYYNGGKSFYLFVPYQFFINEPVYRLDSKYASVFGFIKGKVGDEFKSRLDANVYVPTQILRIPGSTYPNGAPMSHIPWEFTKRTDWDLQLIDLEAQDIDFDFFLPQPPAEITKTSRSAFATITEATRSTEYRAGKGVQKHKNKTIEQFLAKHQTMAPCIRHIAVAITKGESIGFGGRCKLIFECTRAGMTEDEICQIFLLNDDFARYRTLELHPNPLPDTCGYRLTRDFQPSKFADVGCSHSDLASFCEATICYRTALDARYTDNVFGESDPSFESFQESGSTKLKEFLND